jgi:Papain-like cysteine protease AvrRpt2
MEASNTVSWVGQSDEWSCWAAAAAMMLGWRDGVCYANDAEIRAKYNDMGGDGTDPEEDLRLALGQGMAVEATACRTPEAWEQLLQHGPVMTTIPGHYLVISAISGDGTPDGTHVYVLDPAASESWWSFTQLEELYEADPASIMMQY